MADLRVVSITFVSKETNRVYSGDIIALFRQLEALMVLNSRQVCKRINKKLMRIHAYDWPDMNEDFVVVPFGIMKGLDKPLGLNVATQRLAEIEQDMFDVNCLAYYAPYQVALLTINRPGPTMKNIEDYINQFFPPDFPYYFHINPIIKDTLLARMRNTREAHSLDVTLDLGRPLDQLFRRQIVEQHGIIAALNSIANASKEDLASKTFTLSLGLGRARNATMDVIALLELLDELNLDDDAIKEIAVKYRDERTQQLDTAYAKKDGVSLIIPFTYRGRVSGEVLKHNLEDMLREHRNRYFEQVRETFRGTEPIREAFELVQKELEREDIELMGLQQ